MRPCRFVGGHGYILSMNRFHSSSISFTSELISSDATDVRHSNNNVFDSYGRK